MHKFALSLPVGLIFAKKTRLFHLKMLGIFKVYD